MNTYINIHKDPFIISRNWNTAVLNKAAGPLTELHPTANTKLTGNTIIAHTCMTDVYFYCMHAIWCAAVVKYLQSTFIPIATKQSVSLSVSVSQSVFPTPVLNGPKALCALLLMRYKPDLLLMSQL